MEMDYGYETGYGYGPDVEKGYFNWLCELVHIDQEERSYFILAKDLYREEFVPIIAHDENRASDGLGLREEFYRMINYCGDDGLYEDDCSVFEMLIALARRIDFEMSDPNDPDDNRDTTAYWFWEMIENLGLIEYDDDSYVDLEGQTYVDWILDTFIGRTYKANGEGGLFPLRYSTKDQRDVEIWYQMSAYLRERYDV